MLNMKIDDYRITSDSRQVILSKALRDENGNHYVRVNPKGKMEEARTVLGYYSNLSKALVGIQRDYVLHGPKEITNIQEYIESLESITKAYEERLKLNELFS